MSSKPPKYPKNTTTTSTVQGPGTFNTNTTTSTVQGPKIFDSNPKKHNEYVNKLAKNESTKLENKLRQQGQTEILPRPTKSLFTAISERVPEGRRKDKELVKPERQCAAIIGSPNTKTRCWLCGFPVMFIQTNLKNLSNEYYSEYLEKPVCEHVLPIDVALFVTGLVGTKQYADEKLLHTEYEYAHHYCNYVKSNEYFITGDNEIDTDDPDVIFDNAQDFCGIHINVSRISKFLFRLFFLQRSAIIDVNDNTSSTKDTRTHNSRVLYNNIEYLNPVQFFVHHIDKIEGLELLKIDKETLEKAKSIENPDIYFNKFPLWFASRMNAITEKMLKTIGHIKETDGCFNGQPGTHFRNVIASLFGPNPEPDSKYKFNLVSRQPSSTEGGYRQKGGEDIVADLISSQDQLDPKKTEEILTNALIEESQEKYIAKDDVFDTELMTYLANQAIELTSDLSEHSLKQIYENIISEQNIINEQNGGKHINRHRTYRKRNKRRVTRKQRV